jgi:uncharacterized membrane protein YadS
MKAARLLENCLRRWWISQNRRVSRAGIVLYGLRLTFQDIAHVGLAGVAIDAAVLCSTFALACFLGTRVFGLPRTPRC